MLDLIAAEDDAYRRQLERVVDRVLTAHQSTPEQVGPAIAYELHGFVFVAKLLVALVCEELDELEGLDVLRTVEDAIERWPGD